MTEPTLAERLRAREPGWAWVRSLFYEAADALEAKDARIAELEGAVDQLLTDIGHKDPLYMDTQWPGVPVARAALTSDGSPVTRVLKCANIWRAELEKSCGQENAFTAHARYELFDALAAMGGG